MNAASITLIFTDGSILEYSRIFNFLLYDGLMKFEYVKSGFFGASVPMRALFQLSSLRGYILADPKETPAV
jgi:hypothetical protein